MTGRKILLIAGFPIPNLYGIGGEVGAVALPVDNKACVKLTSGFKSHS
jgi:hypothetical protein